MSILDPDHLLEQAVRLVETSRTQSPRQVDLRRAVSAAYYALFHTIAIALADEYVGEDRRSSIDYQLAYRSVNHRWLKQLCEEAAKSSPSKRIKSYLPESGFSPRTRIFAAAVPKLQNARHSADYDPSILLKAADVFFAIDQSREAITLFTQANPRSRRRFLALLAFPPRSVGE